MKLYFYCSSGSLLEYFTLNKIVCNEYLAAQKRREVPSLGNVNSKFLFFTKKKLVPKNRMYGFEQDFLEIPSVLEISVSEECAKNIPVIEVNNNWDTGKEFTKLSEVSEDAQGVFVLGEMSFSYLSAVIFDNENAKDDIYRPSKDLYFPEHLYTVADDSYNEDIDFEKVKEASETLNSLDIDLDISSIIRKRNRIAAIALNTILETKEWQYGNKHIANFDSVTVNLLDIADKLDELTSGEYAIVKDFEKYDEILMGNNDFILAVFFKIFVSELIQLKDNVFSRDIFEIVIKNCFEQLTGEEKDIALLSTIFSKLEDIVYASSADRLEDILATIPKVLQGVLYFMRSPNNPDKLAEGLRVYNASSETRRYAWILFSALNGLGPISSEKTGNSYIMRIAEKTAMERCNAEEIVSVLSDENIPESTFKPEIEEVISADLAKEILLSEEFAPYLQMAIKSFAADKTLVKNLKGFKEKEYKIIQNPFYSEYLKKFPQDEYITLAEAEDWTNRIQKYLKNVEYKYDTEKFCREYISKEKIFNDLFKKTAAFWKKKIREGKKND